MAEESAVPTVADIGLATDQSAANADTVLAGWNQ
jgi:hypothetical protein